MVLALVCGPEKRRDMLVGGKELKQARIEVVREIRRMDSRFPWIGVIGWAMWLWLSTAAGLPALPQADQQQANTPGNASAAATTEADAKTGSRYAQDAGARGKKLILKDGNYQLVRDYTRIGDRVRYLSAERGEWEEIPAAMVDWDATAKAEAAEAKAEAALVSKLHAQAAEQQVEPVLDVDASLMVAKGVYLPSGEGMFAVEGKSVQQLEQVGASSHADKKRTLLQIVSPVPMVPGKRNIEIPGAKAKVRITTSTPEFYLREAPPDPDRTTPILHSSRPGESGPEVELVRATVKGNKRRLESIRDLFGQQTGEERTTVAIQRWEVAPNVYRFTLGEPLAPGEYALTEILQDGMNLYVWDFGVDQTGAVTTKK